MTFRFLDCVLDADARELRRAATPVHLTPKAYELLHLLVSECPRAVSKTELLERVWPGTFVTDASLARTVHEIRDAVGGDPSPVRTVHGHGYAFAGPVTPHTGSAPDPGLASASWLVGGSTRVLLREGVTVIGRDP